MDQLGPYGGHGSARWHIGEESLRIPGPTRAAFSAQEERDWTGLAAESTTVLLGHSLHLLLEASAGFESMSVGDGIG
jgi:hypothetical protein